MTHAMPARSPVPRFLLVTLGITGLYLGLDAVWLTLTPAMESLVAARTAAGWEREKGEVAAAARAADNRLPAESRASAYRLGFEIGYCSNLLGSLAMSPPDLQARVRDLLAPRIQAAQDLARALGAGEAALLTVATAHDYGTMNQRIEADELGLAARVEAAASRRHRHLLLLGMHVGASAALADSTGGQLFNPLRQYIGRHATAADVPPAAWEPVARIPEGATPQQRTAAYAAALATLDGDLARLPPLR